MSFPNFIHFDKHGDQIKGDKDGRHGKCLQNFIRETWINEMSQKTWYYMEDNIKINFKETGCEEVEHLCLLQTRIHSLVPV